jgi:hypothetical protein
LLPDQEAKSYARLAGVMEMRFWALVAWLEQETMTAKVRTRDTAIRKAFLSRETLSQHMRTLDILKLHTIK